MGRAKGDNEHRNDRDDRRSNNNASSSAASSTGTIPVTGNNSSSSSNGASSNNNGTNASNNGKSSKEFREFAEDAGIGLAQAELAAAQALLDSGVGFKSDGTIINKQAAISILARAELDVRRAQAWINGAENSRRRDRNNTNNNQ